jgi:hypothetical protein
VELQTRLFLILAQGQLRLLYFRGKSHGYALKRRLEAPRAGLGTVTKRKVLAAAGNRTPFIHSSHVSDIQVLTLITVQRSLLLRLFNNAVLNTYAIRIVIWKEGVMRQSWAILIISIL